MRQKNYHPWLACLILCLLFFFISCGKKEEDAENTEKQNNGIGGMSQELEGDGVAGTVLELKGKAFGSLAVVGEEDSVYCNLPENVMDWDAIVPICHDPLYDILYYVDYGGDYKIHAIKDGVSETVIELSGKRLFCKWGKLYFLAETRGEFALPGAKSGNVLSYDPTSGEITLIVEQALDSMVVFQDMIYCYQLGEAHEISEQTVAQGSLEWFYFFQSGELLEREKQEIITYQLESKRYGELFIARTIEQANLDYADEYIRVVLESYIAAGIPIEQLRIGTGLQLCNWDGTESILLENMDGSVMYADFYVKGEDIIWFTKDGVFHAYNIPSRQETSKEIKIGKSPRILLNNVVYSADGTCTDLENGTYEICKISAPNNISEITELYTDGNTIYAIVRSGSRGEKRLLCMDYVGTEGSDTHFLRLSAPN